MISSAAVIREVGMRKLLRTVYIYNQRSTTQGHMPCRLIDHQPSFEPHVEEGLGFKMSGSRGKGVLQPKTWVHGPSFCFEYVHRARKNHGACAFAPSAELDIENHILIYEFLRLRLREKPVSHTNYKARQLCCSLAGSK